MKMLDYEKHHFACIYCLEFPDGKKYVGKTHDIGGRIKLYKSAYNDSGVQGIVNSFGIDTIVLRILSKVTCSNKIDTELCLGILEIKYIREENSLSPKGYNKSLGGENLGISPEYITTDKDTIKSLLNGSKILLEYDIAGNFVAEYPSIARFAYEKGYDENGVRASVNKARAYKGKHILKTKRYDYIPEKICVDEIKVIERVKYRDIVKKKEVIKIAERDYTRNGKPVIVYDMLGDFVGEYGSIMEMCRSLGIDRKRHNLGQYSNGYIAYRKVNDDYPRKIESYEQMLNKATKEEYHPVNELDDIPQLDITELEEINKSRCSKHKNLRLDFPIYQYKLNGEFVSKYDSIRDASDATGIAYSSIYACVFGKVKKAKGYIWRKYDK